MSKRHLNVHHRSIKFVFSKKQALIKFSVPIRRVSKERSLRWSRDRQTVRDVRVDDRSLLVDPERHEKTHHLRLGPSLDDRQE